MFRQLPAKAWEASGISVAVSRRFSIGRSVAIGNNGTAFWFPVDNSYRSSRIPAPQKAAVRNNGQDKLRNDRVQRVRRATASTDEPRRVRAIDAGPPIPWSAPKGGEYMIIPLTAAGHSA
jgi:hypothetical protein